MDLRGLLSIEVEVEVEVEVEMISDWYGSPSDSNKPGSDPGAQKATLRVRRETGVPMITMWSPGVIANPAPVPTIDGPKPCRYCQRPAAHNENEYESVAFVRGCSVLRPPHLAPCTLHSHRARSSRACCHRDSPTSGDCAVRSGGDRLGTRHRSRPRWGSRWESDSANHMEP